MYLLSERINVVATSTNPDFVGKPLIEGDKALFDALTASSKKQFIYQDKIITVQHIKIDAVNREWKMVIVPPSAIVLLSL